MYSHIVLRSNEGDSCVTLLVTALGPQLSCVVGPRLIWDAVCRFTAIFVVMRQRRCFDAIPSLASVESAIASLDSPAFHLTMVNSMSAF